MTVRVFNETVLHRFGRIVHVTKLRMVEAETRCGVRYVMGQWPKGHARPKLPRCVACS